MGSTIVSQISSLFGARRPSEKDTDNHPLKPYNKLTEPVGQGQFSRETGGGTSTSVHKETEWEMDRTEVENTVHIV